MVIEVKKEGSSLTLCLKGEINNLAAPGFENVYTDNRENVREVIIDMEQVTYLTSAALRVLLRIQQDMNDLGGSLKVCHVNDVIMEVFTFAGFDSFLTIQ